MINETINNTLTATSTLKFEDALKVTNDPSFILAMLIVWLLPIIIYLIIGACVKGGGKYYNKRMIEFPNFWYAILVWFFIQGALFLILVVFPVWLKLMVGS